MAAFITFIIVGLIAGWIAGLIMKGRGLGVLGDIIVGVIGALLGGYIFRQFGITGTGFLGSVITAVVGAVILLLIISLVRKETGGPSV